MYRALSSHARCARPVAYPLGFLELVCPFFPRHRNAEAPGPGVVHVMKLVGGCPNSMLVLSFVNRLATVGPQTTSAY